jgi:hypothetical protein
MDAIAIALWLIGAFYVFAGVVATRAGLTSYFIDRAIAAIALKKPSTTELAQTVWLLVAANVIFIGGLALMIFADFAALLFVVSAAAQAIYLTVVAPRLFDPHEPPDAKGRRATVNAFLIYTAATVAVLAAWKAGRLSPWPDIAWPWRAAFLAAIGLQAGTILRALWPARSSTADAVTGDDDFEGHDTALPGDDLADCRRFKVMADYGTHPLWAMDGYGGDVAPEALGLPDDLVRDLDAWAGAYTASLNYDDPAVSRWSDGEHLAHAEAGRALAMRVAHHRPDLEIYVPDGPIRVARVTPEA